jgi:hypothetical protein
MNIIKLNGMDIENKYCNCMIYKNNAGREGENEIETSIKLSRG